VLKEAHIKPALASWLRNRGELRGGVLIDEKVYGEFARRADLVVANGTLQAFEIKSDADSLRRLSGQVADYLLRFDKLTVVCTPRFTRSVVRSINRHVGVIEVLRTGRAYRFRLVRRGLSVAITDRKRLAEFLLKPELGRLLRSEGKKVSRDCARGELVEMLSNVSVSRIHTFVIACLKARYQPTRHRRASTNQAKISRTTTTWSDLGQQSNVSARDSARRVMLNLSRVLPSGTRPDSFPTFILRRTRVRQELA
jgi:hypothetical protein